MQGKQSASYGLSGRTLDTLFPMHAILDDRGAIIRAGPTLKKVAHDNIVGATLFDTFDIQKPRSIKTIDQVRSSKGKKILLRLQEGSASGIQLRAIATALEGQDDFLLLDFAFGADFVDTFPLLDLNTGDFKPNDLSLDLIYTIETQRTLVEDSFKLTTALENSKKKAEQAANIDLLTGIANRRSLYAFLEREISRFQSQPGWLLMHIDLDSFKAINDTWGHAAGDEVLKHAASVLAQIAGTHGFSARLGGDEFVLVTSIPEPEADGQALADHICHRICEPIQFDGQRLRVTASVGIVQLRNLTSASPDELLSHSDIALYEAKRTQTRCALLSSEMLERHKGRNALISEIRSGIEANQFVPFFQPKIDTKHSTIVGFEVLVRWQHPERGLLLPSDFIEEAQDANLMGAIEKSIIVKALSSYSGWLKSDGTLGRLSINLTAANLFSPVFFEYLKEGLHRVGLTPENIELELLESIIFESADSAMLGRCRQLRDEGFHLTLDDFGTGYASISSLIDNTIETIKIDRSFVSGIHKDHRLQRITRTIMALSQQLGLSVIAEGVETLAELEVLNAFGCDVIQGYLFGPPLGEDDISVWLKKPRDASFGLRTAGHASLKKNGCSQ